jgi:hypothetical protein
MKNLPTFAEFINESSLNEGALASKAFKNLDKVDVIMDDTDPSSHPIQLKACELLGEDPGKVCRVDSEGEFEGDIDLFQNTYDTINGKFSYTKTDLGNFKLESGMDIVFDPKLKVVRVDDNGMVCYYFTTKSNF